jgi:hypothetical protein
VEQAADTASRRLARQDPVVRARRRLRIWHAYTTHKLKTTNSTNPVVHGIDHADMVVGIFICQVQLQAL